MRTENRKSRFRVAAAAGVVCVAITTTGACSTAVGPPDGHVVPPIASAWVTGWRNNATHGLAALFTEDATYTDQGVGKVSHGRDGVAAWQQNTYKLIPDANIELTDAFRNGDRVSIEGTYTGQIQGAPRPFALPLATVLQLRGNQIVSDTDYYNLADLLRESGLPPTWTPPQG